MHRNNNKTGRRISNPKIRTNRLPSKISKLENECKELKTKVEDLVKYTEYLSENLNTSMQYSEYLAEEFDMFMNVVQLMIPDLPLGIKKTLKELVKNKTSDYTFLKELYDCSLLVPYCDSIAKAHENKEDLDEVDSLFRNKIIAEERKKKIETVLD